MVTSFVLISSRGYAASGAGISDTSSVFLGVLKAIFYTIVFVAVIFLTLYGTKYIAKNFNRLANSKYIDNIDAISLSNNTQINIVKIDKYIYVLCVGEGKSFLIDKILETEFSYETIDRDYNPSVIGVDNEMLNKIKKFLNKEDKNEKGN